MIYGLDKLAGVHPRLWAAMGLLAVKSKYDWKIVSGKRDAALQAKLYAQGRTEPGEIVTDVKDSAHLHGLAVDVQPTLDKGKSVVQDSTHPAYDEKDTIFRSNPLGVRTNIAISSGPDRPHIEIQNWQAHKDWLTTYSGITVALVSLCLLFGSSSK